MVQPLALPQPGDVVGRKYRIVSRIGAGGMGVVLEAINVDTEGRVALKWLNPELSSSPEAVERFKLEARATGRIRHPNVVAIHDIGEHEGHLYLVMEFLTGAPLRARISEGPLDVYEACRVLFPVMRGVAAAHAVKILHRDIKPDNIFLSESPDGLEAVPKVLDFGIAKLCSDSERTGSASARTAMMGTYQYMALEQLHGRRDLDERVDIYALGAVLYNMLTGRLPYQADNPVDLALQMLQGPPEPVTNFAPAVPPGMAQVIARALTRERDQRYASVEQLAFDLEPYAQGTRYKGQQGARGPTPVGQLSPISTPPASVPPLRTPFQVSSAPVDPFGSATPSRPPSGRVRPAPSGSASSGSAFDLDTDRLDRAVRTPAARSRWPLALGAVVLVAGGGVAWRLLGSSGTAVPNTSQVGADTPQEAAPPPTAPISPGLDKAQNAAPAADDWGSADAPPDLRAAPPPQDPVAVPAPTQPDAEVAPQQWPNAAGEWPSATGQWPSATARPDAGVRTSGARERNRRPPRADEPAKPAAETPKPSNEERGNGFGNNTGLDMTDLPAPSWASDPKR